MSRAKGARNPRIPVLASPLPLAYDPATLPGPRRFDEAAPETITRATMIIKRLIHI